MADIRLAKPAAGASESVQCAPDARFVFDFPTTDATLAREGDNLNISFQDGSQLQLQGFYQEYNGENLPSFNIDGTEVAAADFFQAMNEPDLMPAAGPGTGTVANGARFHEWGDSALTGGIEHLNGLEWGFSRAFEWDDVPNAVGYHDDDEGGWRGAPANNPVTLTPENPGSVPPGTIVPGDDPENPTTPTPGNQGIVPPGDVRLVSEAGLREGAPVTVDGAMRVSAPDGLASIEIDGRVIWQNGHMVDNPTFATDEGYFHSFAYDAASGRLTYTYTLDHATKEHKLAGPDYIAHSLPLTVRDVDGDFASSNITIIIRDDVPEIARPVHEAGGDTVTDRDTGAEVANAVQDTAQAITLKLDGLTLGADDGEGKSVPQALTVQVAGQTFTFAVTTDPDGNYSFAPQEGSGNSAMEISGNREDGYRLLYTRPESDRQQGDEARSDTYTFDIQVKDADGDIAATSQTIRTNVTPNVKPKDPEKPDTPDNPDNPDNPVNPDEPDNPDKPDAPDNPAAGLRVSSVTVNEAYLDRGNPDGADDATSATAAGSFIVNTHGEGGTLVLSFSEEEGGEPKTITIELNEDDSWISQVADVIDTKFGTLQVTNVEAGTVEYTYTLKANYGEHDAPHSEETPDNEKVLAERNTAADVDTFQVTLTDNIGHDRAEGTLGVSIIDDIPVIGEPVLVAGEQDIVPEKDNDGNVVKDEDGNAMVLDDAVQDTAGTITLKLDGLKFGADDGEGATLTVEVDGQTFTFDVTAGKDHSYNFGEPKEGADGSAMKIEADGEGGYQLVYTRPTDDVQQGEGAASDTYTFDITVKDADGDIATTSQTIRTNVTPDVGPDPKDSDEPTDKDPDLGLRLSDVTVNEAYLELGNQPEGAESASKTATGTFVANTHGEGGTLKLELGDKSITIKLDEQDNWVVEDGENGWKTPEKDYTQSFDTEYGTLTVTQVAAGVVSYTYELTSPYGEHVNETGKPIDRDTAEDVEKISVILTDDIGHDQVKGMLGVHIVDDIPVLEKIEFTNDPMENNVAEDKTQYISDSDATISGTLTGLSLGADADKGTVTLTVNKVDPETGEVSGGDLATVTYTVTVTENDEGKQQVTLHRPATDTGEERPPLKIEVNEEGEFTFEYARNEEDIKDVHNDPYRFTATVVDKDGDTVTKDAQVVTNRAPTFFTPPEEEGGKPEPLEPGAQVASSTVHESVLTDPNPGQTLLDGSQHGAGEGASLTHKGSFGIDTHGEGGSVTFTLGGQKIEFDLSGTDQGTPKANSSSSINIGDGLATFTVTGIAEGGLVSYTFTLNKALADTGTDPNDLWNTVGLNTITVELTDGVNQDVATGHITLNVVDDAPVFTEDSGTPRDFSVDMKDMSHLSFDFTQIDGSRLGDYFGTITRNGYVKDQSQGKWFSTQSDSTTRPAGYLTANNDTFAITPTFVHYQYTQDETGALSVQNVVDLNNGIYQCVKALDFSKANGLSVGGNFEADAWNGTTAGEISVGSGTLYMAQGGKQWYENFNHEVKSRDIPDKRYKLANEYGGDKSDYNTISGANVSEAVVFDLQGDVAYGFDISFKNLGEGDRVLVTFMMTPKNSNDDTIVKMVEVNSAHPGIIQVEEGFSKVIVSSVPKGNDYTLDETGLWATSTDNAQETNSGFTIATIDFFKAIYTAHGTVEAHSADGVESYAWDWSDIDGSWVHVKGANSGDYKVTVDQATGTATLSGGTGNLETGTKLFTTTLDGKSGEWSVTLNYEFTLLGKDLENPAENPGNAFKIVASEPGNGNPENGDKVTQIIDIDPKFNRFSEMLTGKTTNDSSLSVDVYDDRIGGQDGNSLIYGKGGDDILLGDKLQWEKLAESDYDDVLTALKGMEINGVQEGNATTNNAFIAKVQALDYTQKHDLGEQLEKLENTVDGGNDAIYGGLGNDFIFAGAGDDVILGYGKKNPAIKDDSDIIYAGSGHDLIFYNYGDAQEDGSYRVPDGLYINGGTGNDLLLGNKNMPSLKDLKDAQTVDNVEVLLKATKLDSVNSLGITSHTTLLTYGIALGEAGLLLDNSVWQEKTEGGVITGYTNTKFTLEDGKEIAAGALELEVDGVEVYGVAVPDDSTFAEVVGTTPTNDHVADLIDEGIIPEVPTAPGQGDAPEQASFSMRPMSLRGGAHDTADTGDSGDTGGTAQDCLAERLAAAESVIEGDPDKPDTLFGTEGDDVIIGGSAGDFIDGGTGSDIIFAGGGDDLIVYDHTDYFIDGGTGLDFLLSDGKGTQHTLADMIGNWQNRHVAGHDDKMPMVNDVEVMLKGVDTNLQNMNALAEEYGFRIEDNRLILGEQWKEVENSANGTTTTYHNGAGITLETTLTEIKSAGEEAGDQAAQQIVLGSNG